MMRIKEVEKKSLFLFDTVSKTRADVWNALQCWDGKRKYEYDAGTEVTIVGTKRFFERPTVGNPLLLPIEVVLMNYDGAIPPTNLVDLRDKYLKDKKFSDHLDAVSKVGESPSQQIIENPKKIGEVIVIDWGGLPEFPTPLKVKRTSAKGSMTMILEWKSEPGKRPILATIVTTGFSAAKNKEGTSVTYNIAEMSWDNVNPKDITFDLNRSKRIIDDDTQMEIEP